jgi:putative transposase
MKKTKLIAFIDDASRVCVHAEFYWDERLPSMIDTFSKALLKRGRPCRLLLDNAFIYHSATLASMCAQLPIELEIQNLRSSGEEGIKISFCTPRRPQGKGKIERWNLTVQTGFYHEAQKAGLTTLAELNQYFHAWIEKEYNRRVHEELGMTPLERWQKDVHRIHPVTAEEIRRALMLRARRRVHENTCTVLLEGEEYQVSPPYMGKMVDVRWHPDTMQEVEIWLDGVFVEVAQRIERHTHVPRRKEPDEPPDYAPLSSAKKYVQEVLAEDGQTKLPLLKSNELLASDEFLELVSQTLCRQLTEAEHAKLHEFFVRFAPMGRQTAQAALLQAVDAKGARLHMRFYLQHLEQVVQRNRR